MGSLLFSSPLVLAALLALPGLWWLLRLLPPKPKKILFPPLDLLRATDRERPEPRHTPLWILILRVGLVTALILAMAGPRFVTSALSLSGSGPVLVIFDNGWSSAPDWAERTAFIKEIIAEAEDKQRPVALLPTGQQTAPLEPLSPEAARLKLAAITPLSFAPSLDKQSAPLSDFLSRFKNADIIYLPEAVSIGTESHAVFDRFADHPLVIVTSPHEIMALAGASQTKDGMVLRVLRARSGVEQTGRVIAYNAQSRPVGDVAFRFDQNDTETKARLKLPTEMLNRIASFTIEGERSAGASWLMGADGRRARVGLVGMAENESDNRLADPSWYIRQALAPSVDLFNPRMGQSEAIAALITSKVDAIILGDSHPPSDDTLSALKAYCEAGGTVIRFAGPFAPKEQDHLWPVRLRSDGRTLGGALDWQAPRHLAPFPDASPFADLAIPDDVVIRRQWLADPDGLANESIWAKLDDGTPLVTASHQGRGRIVLFHSAADPTWGTLPVSGLFVEMLQRIATRTLLTDDINSQSKETPQAPFALLDGYGVIGSSVLDAEPIIPGKIIRADAAHPAGFYGPRDAPYAVNVLAAKDSLGVVSLPDTPKQSRVTLDQTGSFALEPYCLGAAIILFLIDTLVALGISRRLVGARAHIAKLILWICFAVIIAATPDAHSQTLPLSPKERDATLSTRLAYVITGDATLDEISRDGLSGLSLYLQDHTGIEPEDPVGLDLETDTLSLYPLLYWPIPALGKKPSAAALARLETYMRNGGLVIFDTRDAEAVSGAGQVSAEGVFLRALLSGLSVPPLEELPANHVVMRSFYLLQNMPGRFATGKTWVEALPQDDRTSNAPARASDGVSPLVITSNDLASAWAIDRSGHALYPIETTIPRQREMALRAGVNLVMYALTGNYKADQIHVPALLERLGR